MPVTLFIDIKKPVNVLNYLLTPHEIHGDKKDKLRHPYPYAMCRANTLRLNRSFIAYCITRRISCFSYSLCMLSSSA